MASRSSVEEDRRARLDLVDTQTIKRAGDVDFVPFCKNDPGLLLTVAQRAVGYSHLRGEMQPRMDDVAERARFPTLLGFKAVALRPRFFFKPRIFGRVGNTDVGQQLLHQNGGDVEVLFGHGPGAVCVAAPDGIHNGRMLVERFAHTLRTVVHSIPEPFGMARQRCERLHHQSVLGAFG